MARSRIGGSSGLLSGKIGDVIYSITRNPDGSFRQQIAQNPESRFNPNTDDQARARCTMGTIERAMFTFRDFVASGFEGVERGTLSVSEFSRVNYNELKGLLDVLWEFTDIDNYQYNLPKKGQGQPRGGTFILSQGSLTTPIVFNEQYGRLGNPVYNIWTRAIDHGVTLGEWLSINHLRPGDQIVRVFFEEGVTPSKACACYYLLATNPNVNVNTVITKQNFRSLLILQSNVPATASFNNDTRQLSFSLSNPEYLGFNGVSLTGDRLRRQDGGRILYNNCQLFQVGLFDFVEYGWQAMKTVKNSWTNID